MRVALKQKMYRILGMMNRAKGMLNKVSDEKKKILMKPF